MVIEVHVEHCFGTVFHMMVCDLKKAVFFSMLFNIIMWDFCLSLQNVHYSQMHRPENTRHVIKMNI